MRIEQTIVIFISFGRVNAFSGSGGEGGGSSSGDTTIVVPVHIGNEKITK